MGRRTRSSATRSRCTRARSSPGFYPPDEAIAAQTQRNREAVLQLLENADCMYRVIGKQAQYCGVAARPRCSPTTSRPTAVGRRTRAGTDTATTGRFERGNPETTTSSGTKQLGTTVSGVNDLVTARLAGADGGRRTTSTAA